jgi:positive regulator of sigma E activity
MTQSGVVNRIEGDRVWVAVGQAADAPDAGMAAAACCSPGVSIIEARKPRGLSLSVGDEVHLNSEFGQALGLGALAVGVPLVTLLAAYLAAKPWFGIDGGLGQALVSLAGLALGLVFPVIYFRFFRRPANYPIVSLD